MYPIKNLIAATDTKNDTTHPKINSENSANVKWKPNLTNFKKLAPNITGIARKNVNSAATPLAVPIKSAPTIVAPEREVPGISANT